jgi:hypothetical protein
MTTTANRIEGFPDDSVVIDTGLAHIVIPRSFSSKHRNNDAHVCALQMVPRCLFYLEPLNHGRQASIIST